MIATLLALQEAAGHGADAVAQGTDPAANAGPDLQGMLMHHLADGRELEVFGYVVHLPRWEPLHLGPLALDLSPTKHVVFVVLAALLCILVFVGAARSLRRTDPSKAPSGLANALEALILYFREEVIRRNIGHGADAYAPYVLTLFVFILFMNLFGLVPFGATATGNLSVTAALAILTFILVEITGMRSLGLSRYAKTIFYAPPGMPVWGQAIMLVIMTPVEFLGKLTKPFALAIRLFANMTAGHTLVLSLLGLIFMFGSFAVAGASVAMSTAVMVLEVFVAFLQAYIFAMLTAVFIGLIRHAH